jgi:uncharacterized protein (TIGR00725 family)
MRTQVHVPSPKINPAIRKVAFFGSADIDEQDPIYQEAFNVARHLAYHDKVIVNGGGPGVMQAATTGAQSVGGQTLVVTFAPDPLEAPEFEGRFEGNKADVEIKTRNYIERMFGLMEHSDIFIVFKGGTGTLSEWATAWLMAHIYYGHHKPLILYGEFWKTVIECMSDNFFIGSHEMEVFKIVKDEAELIPAFEFFEGELQKRMTAKWPL